MSGVISSSRMLNLDHVCPNLNINDLEQLQKGDSLENLPQISENLSTVRLEHFSAEARNERRDLDILTPANTLVRSRILMPVNGSRDDCVASAKRRMGNLCSDRSEGPPDPGPRSRRKHVPTIILYKGSIYVSISVDRFTVVCYRVGLRSWRGISQERVPVQKHSAACG